ncbi:hypothetical protein GT347_00900 [Xylophilus rhododendri]|uniref:Uncharacterized protein n=1 Tax=Xylophilus rhododendri TaxID=2697032 RepID=A0A857J072_9BURK|nr:hypothetical protein [Xylophilus rhododendri]QHI96673.1 hypothetical protein GT347_00900 [Xylophilus rhododendri]
MFIPDTSACAAATRQAGHQAQDQRGTRDDPAPTTAYRDETLAPLTGPTLPATGLDVRAVPRTCISHLPLARNAGPLHALWHCPQGGPFSEQAERLGIRAITGFVRQHITGAGLTMKPQQAFGLIETLGKETASHQFQDLLDALKPHAMVALQEYLEHWEPGHRPPFDNLGVRFACARILSRLPVLRPDQVREWTAACQPVWGRTPWAIALFDDVGAETGMNMLVPVLLAAGQAATELQQQMLSWVAEGIRRNTDRFPGRLGPGGPAKLIRIVARVMPGDGGNAVFGELMRIWGVRLPPYLLSKPERRHEDLAQITLAVNKLDDTADPADNCIVALDGLPLPVVQAVASEAISRFNQRRHGKQLTFILNAKDAGMLGRQAIEQLARQYKLPSFHLHDRGLAYLLPAPRPASNPASDKT